MKNLLRTWFRQLHGIDDESSLLHRESALEGVTLTPFQREDIRNGPPPPPSLEAMTALFPAAYLDAVVAPQQRVAAMTAEERDTATRRAKRALLDERYRFVTAQCKPDESPYQPDEVRTWRAAMIAHRRFWTKSSSSKSLTDMSELDFTITLHYAFKPLSANVRTTLNEVVALLDAGESQQAHERLTAMLEQDEQWQRKSDAWVEQVDQAKKTW